VLAGLETPDAGETLVLGRVPDEGLRRTEIALVAQDAHLIPFLSARENVELVLELRRADVAAAGESLDAVGLGELADERVSRLSTGERQRVALARAIATKADVLLMDEPLSNLDALLRMEMRAELKALLRQLGTTTIYVTHDQVEALSMGDRIAVMKAGVIAQVDTPLAVYDHPADTYVGGFVGTPPMNFIDAEVHQNGGAPVVRLNGGSFPLAGVDGRGLAGRLLTLGIRAEAIQVRSAEVDGLVRARVVVVEPLGSHNLLTVRVGDDLLKVSTPPDLSPAPDSDVWLALDPARIRWMDRETGDAVAATTG
jgi:multiple sugar transport system ATP-binding protein